MEYAKEVTVNLGNYENMKIGVSKCIDFETCDYEIQKELKRQGIERSVRGVK